MGFGVNIYVGKKGVFLYMYSQMSARVGMLEKTNVCISSRNLEKIMRALLDSLEWGNFSAGARVSFAFGGAMKCGVAGMRTGTAKLGGNLREVSQRR